MPKCNRCGLHMRNANSEAHYATVECIRYAERMARYQRTLKQEAALTVTFAVGGNDIERVSEFRYLGRVLSETDDDSCALHRQLARARAKWGRLASVLRSQGVEPRAMGYFYKAIIQAVLLYGSETWVVTDCNLRQLRSFHARVARYLTGRHMHPNADGTWFYPPTHEVLQEAGLETIDEYIKRRRHTVLEFVGPRPLYDVCRRSPAFTAKAVWWQLT